MLIEQAIRTQLAGTTAVAALVGERIYYGKALQDAARPYLVINKISAQREHAHDGALGMVNARIQISCFAGSYAAAKSLAVAVQAVLECYQGTLGGVGGVYVGSCFYDNEVDFWEEETKLHHIAADYLLQYNE